MLNFTFLYIILNNNSLIVLYIYKDKKVNSSCFVLHLSCKRYHICVINCKFRILKILYIF